MVPDTLCNITVYILLFYMIAVSVQAQKTGVVTGTGEGSKFVSPGTLVWVSILSAVLSVILTLLIIVCCRHLVKRYKPKSLAHSSGSPSTTGSTISEARTLASERMDFSIFNQEEVTVRPPQFV